MLYIPNQNYQCTQKFTLELLQRKMQHEKKSSLVVEPRDLIKNNDRARTFP